MKSGVKSLRNLLIPAIVFLVLIAVLTVINYFYSREPSPSVTDESEDAEILAIDPAEIQSFVLIRRDGSTYSINRSEEGSSFHKWVFQSSEEKYESDLYSDDQIELFLLRVATLYSSKSIPADTNALTEYGLDEPLYRITISMNSGAVRELSVGALSFDGLSAYATVDAGNFVYLIPAENVAEYEVQAIDFFDRKALDLSDKEIETLTFSRMNHPIKIYAQFLENSSPVTETPTWAIVEPIAFRSGELFDRMAHSLMTIEVDAYVAGSRDSLSAYGLDQPEYSYSIRLRNGKTVQVYLSRKISNKYYGYSDLMPGVFVISESRVVGLDLSLEECYFPYPVHEKLYDLKAIKAVFPEGEFEMEMVIEEGMNLANKDAVIKVDRRSAKVTDSFGNSYFLVLYSSIMELDFSRVSPDAVPFSDVEISFLIIKRDSKTIQLDFAAADDKNYYVFVDGEYIGFQVSADQLYAANLSDPGVWYAYELLNEALDGQINGKYDIPVS